MPTQLVTGAGRRLMRPKLIMYRPFNLLWYTPCRFRSREVLEHKDSLPWSSGKEDTFSYSVQGTYGIFTCSGPYQRDSR